MPGGSARGFRALFCKKKKRKEEGGRFLLVPSLRYTPVIIPLVSRHFAAAAVWGWAYLSSDLARFHGEWHQREAEMWTSSTSPNLRNSVFMWPSPWLASDPVIRIESGEEEEGGGGSSPFKEFFEVSQVSVPGATPSSSFLIFTKLTFSIPGCSLRSHSPTCKFQPLGLRTGSLRGPWTKSDLTACQGWFYWNSQL